jgi:hypothetical protein
MSKKPVLHPLAESTILRVQFKTSRLDALFSLLRTTTTKFTLSCSPTWTLFSLLIIDQYPNNNHHQHLP